MGEKEEASSGSGSGSGGDNKTSRGTDWEVVSLTASAYAASPGPKPPVQSNDDVTAPSEAETSHPLYMSRHFAFPSTEAHHTTEPSEENKASKKMDSDFSIEQETGKEDGGDLSLDLARDDDGFDFSFEEEKGKSYKVASLQDDDERAFGGSHVYQQSEPVHHQQTEDIAPDVEEDDQDDKHHQIPPPCEPWWKRSAASLLSQAKETNNTVWSIIIAAAVMGVVVLGQRWQHERWQVLQLNWESTIGNEKAGRLMGPISRLKQAFVGGQRRDSFIRASSQNDS